MTKAEPKQYSVSVPFLAVCIVLGIIATAELLYLLNKPSTQTTVPVKKVQPTVTPTPAPLFLQVDKPGSDAKSIKGELLVTGTTNPYTIVALYSDTDDSLMQSDEKGMFENTVMVGTGGTFGVSAFSLTGEEKSVYFFAGAPEEATAGAALEKPQKLGVAKLKEALSGSGSAALKIETLQVHGVEAMELRRHAIIGTTATVTQGTITLSSSAPQGIGKILFDSKTVATATRTAASDKIALEPGYLIIAIGTLAEGGLQASRIHVIPVTPTSFQDQLPSFSSSAESSQGTGSLNGVINNIQKGVLPTISLVTPSPTPTPIPVL